MKDIYFIGYGMMETFHYQYKSKSDRKLRQSAAILYEKKYAEYYVRLAYAQKISLSFTLLLVGFILYGFIILRWEYFWYLVYSRLLHITTSEH